LKLQIAIGLRFYFNINRIDHHNFSIYLDRKTTTPLHLAIKIKRAKTRKKKNSRDKTKSHWKFVLPVTTYVSMAPKDKPIFFYSPKDHHGVFSQWHMSTFTVRNSIITTLVGPHLGSNVPDASTTFNCAEQFMMYCKAACFSDTASQRRALNAEHPNAQKKIGQLVSDYDEIRWTEVKSKVVEAGNYAKFSQDAGLREYLVATGKRELVEAAKRDRIWGIGYAAKTEAEEWKALANRELWGENRLGKALEVVRERLRAEATTAASSQKVPVN
jgi:ribA/ribD-fused uncharacterized protein